MDDLKVETRFQNTEQSGDWVLMLMLCNEF
jgi:hypothetical protein